MELDWKLFASQTVSWVLIGLKWMLSDLLFKIMNLNFLHHKKESLMIETRSGSA